MRKLESLVTWTTAAALAIALGVVPLVGCSSADQEATDKQSEANEQVADDAEDGAESESSGATADKQEAGPVWVVSKQTGIYTSEGDTYTMYMEYTRDEQGNALSLTQREAPEAGADPESAFSYTEVYELDEDGYAIASQAADDDSGESRQEYAIKKDDDGNMIEYVADDGDYVVKQTFGEDGKLQKQDFSSAYATVDEDGTEVEGLYEGTALYNDEGYIESVESTDGTNRTRGEYEYEHNDKGQVTSATYREWELDENGEKVGDPVQEMTVAIKWNKDGNIARTTSEVDGQKSVIKFEWVKVENPSVAARAEAAQPVI